MTTYGPPPGSYRAPTDIDDSADHTPRPITQRLGAILWPSFFAAGVATSVLFAAIDPDDLNRITWANADLSREAGYTIGFFMFWGCTMASSLFTWVLLRPRGRWNPPLRRDD